MTLPLFEPGYVQQNDAVIDRDTWATPRELASHLVGEFGCTLDVAASAQNAKCERFYSACDDGLSQEWPRKSIIWCNPPYSDVTPWVTKAIAYARDGGFRAVLLLPSQVGLGWFTSMTMWAEWWTFNKRIRFVAPPGAKDPGANFGNVLAVFGYGYTPMWRGVRDAVTGGIVFDVAKKPQRQRSR